MTFFEITHREKHTGARTGVIHTAHGDIQTPAFMPVGTQATVKSLDPRDLKEVGAPIVLANTYHLHLRPGEDVIAELGGLHRFMGWAGPILTDSGGFQVFSLKHKNMKTLKHENKNQIRKSGLPARQRPEPQALAGGSGYPDISDQGKLVAIDDDGVTFRSHIDGSPHRFTPESAIEIQHKLGADIIMAFDECTPDNVSEDYAREAMERTHRWAERSFNHHKNIKTLKHKNISQFLFGIIQGAQFENLRKESARFISSLPFAGIAIGGESIGYNMEATKEILKWIMPIIPEDKPHYTMGVGSTPPDIFEVVERGVDMFDCVAPTRMARNGTLYLSPPHTRGSTPTESGGGGENRYRLNITNAQFANDKSPIDPHCDCSTCAQFSRAYLHHLFNANELLAFRLATIHNVRFMLKLMEDIREAIRADWLMELKKEWI